MKNLLIITQKVDEDNDLLGFFVGWIREFAEHFDRVFVVALGKGRYELPANVEIFSLGKEKHTKSARLAASRNTHPPKFCEAKLWRANAPIRLIIKFVMGFRFYWYLFKLVPKSSGIFAHMSPIFAVAAAPVARLYHKKIVVWYLHRSVTFRLRLAALLSYKIVTASAESLGIKSPSKIIAVGHGIDIKRFQVSGFRFQDGEGPVRILSVGRISPIKNYETLIEAIDILTKTYNLKPITCSIVGRPVMAGDGEYFYKLEKMVEEKCLKEQVRFAGFVPFSKMPVYYKDADIVVNLTPKGGIDKTVLEAMASGALVLVANQVFEKMFGPYAKDLIFRENDPGDLTAKIRKLTAMPSVEKTQISAYLQSVIAQNHELAKTVESISQLF